MKEQRYTTITIPLTAKQWHRLGQLAISVSTSEKHVSETDVAITVFAEALDAITPKPQRRPRR